MEQGTPEWFQARVGRVTASRVSDIISKTKSGYSASRANYMAELICERISGKKNESFTSSAMQHGIDTEPLARAAYQAKTGEIVQKAGFVVNPLIPMAGASPDGLIDADGLIEIKCPNTATHIETLLANEVPTKYIPQMQFQMACTNREWCDFVSYDPRMPENMSIFIHRVKRDVEYIVMLEKEVKKFLGELDEKLNSLKSIYGLPADDVRI